MKDWRATKKTNVYILLNLVWAMNMTLKISALMMAEFNFGLSQMKRISPRWNCGILQIPDISFPWLNPVPLHTFAKSQYFNHYLLHSKHSFWCLKKWRVCSWKGWGPTQKGPWKPENHSGHVRMYQIWFLTKNIPARSLFIHIPSNVNLGIMDF